jgi:ribokinase
VIFDVAVVGKANVDYLARAPRLPRPGEGVNGDLFQEAAGGKGANQAVGAARLGARAALVARVGSDARGALVLEALRREGVDARFVSRDAAERTGVALCQVDEEGQKQMLSFLGANARLSAGCVREAAPVLGSCKVLLVQLGVPREALVAALQIARGAGAKVVLDAAPGIPAEDSLLAQVELVRPNRFEAEALTGLRVRDRASAREAAAQLLRRGARSAVVQAGHDGDVLLWEGGEAWLPRFPVKAVDATGAGDAFSSALAVCIAEGRPLPEAGRFASAAAALATTVLGAQASLPARTAVQRLLDA